MSVDGGRFEFALFEFGETGLIFFGKIFLAIKEHLSRANQITKTAFSQLGGLCDAHVVERLVHVRDDMEAVVDNGRTGNRKGGFGRQPIGFVHVHGDGLDALLLLFCQAVKQGFETRPTVPRSSPVNAAAIQVHQQRHEFAALPV